MASRDPPASTKQVPEYKDQCRTNSRCHLLENEDRCRLISPHLVEINSGDEPLEFKDQCHHQWLQLDASAHTVAQDVEDQKVHPEVWAVRRKNPGTTTSVEAIPVDTGTDGHQAVISLSHPRNADLSMTTVAIQLLPHAEAEVLTQECGKENQTRNRCRTVLVVLVSILVTTAITAVSIYCGQGGCASSNTKDDETNRTENFTETPGSMVMLSNFTFLPQPDNSCHLSEDLVWNQIGQPLDGLSAPSGELGNRFGWSVALSSNGAIVAGGAYTSIGVNGEQQAGHVRVYKHSSSLHRWEQLGQELHGNSSLDKFGWDVALSANGEILAVGATNGESGGLVSGQVVVFRYDRNSDRWVQMGQKLNGEVREEDFGVSVPLSSNGNVVAAGGRSSNVRGANSGHAIVLSFNKETLEWEKMDQDLYGSSKGDQFGRTVALSSDGTILAVGAYESENLKGSAQVFVYDNTQKRWDQLGQKLDGEAEGDKFGISLALSSVGHILACGGWYNSEVGYHSGHVQVFQYNNAARMWEQRGNDLNGEEELDQFGRSVALSADGCLIGVGANRKFNLGGQIRVLQYNSIAADWVQIGHALDKEYKEGNVGLSVAISADGKTLAGGAPGSYRASGGQVIVFDVGL